MYIFFSSSLNIKFTIYGKTKAQEKKISNQKIEKETWSF